MLNLCAAREVVLLIIKIYNNDIYLYIVSHCEKMIRLRVVEKKADWIVGG